MAGLRRLLVPAHRFLTWHLGGPRARLSRPTKSFRFQGREHAYCFHKYNYSWSNERTVEIPLALDVLRAHEGKRVLEVGNVLSHYVPIRHAVVDKYERAPGVQNVDVVDFAPQERHDLVLSVSTLEHVGWDETPREPGKAERALHHLKSLVSPGGLLFVTVPLGWNPPLDDALRSGRAGCDVAYLRRRNDANEWEEIGAKDAEGALYGDPWAGGIVVAVATWRAPLA